MGRLFGGKPKRVRWYKADEYMPLSEDQKKAAKQADRGKGKPRAPGKKGSFLATEAAAYDKRKPR